MLLPLCGFPLLSLVKFLLMVEDSAEMLWVPAKPELSFLVETIYLGAGAPSHTTEPTLHFARHILPYIVAFHVLISTILSMILQVRATFYFLVSLISLLAQ